jgi:hypothetical protein
MKPNLMPPGIERLKVKCDTLLSTSAFIFDLRRYVEVHVVGWCMSTQYCPCAALA